VGLVKGEVLVGEGLDGIRQQVLGSLYVSGGAPLVFFNTITLPAY